MAVRKWKVRINGGNEYFVDGPYAAEAASEGVIAYRNDTGVHEVARNGPIWYIETQWLHPPMVIPSAPVQDRVPGNPR